MAKGYRRPVLNVMSAMLPGVEYPVTREELVDAAAGDDSPTALINFLKCLPGAEYQSALQVERDFAEAARRFGMGADLPAWLEADRSNLGIDAIEHARAPHTRHP